MSYAGLVTVLVVLAIFALFIGLYRWLREIRQLGDHLLHTMDSSSVSARQSLTQTLDNQLGGMSFGAHIERQLVAADSRLTVSEFFLLRFGLTLLFFALGWGISGYLIGGLLLLIVGWGLPGFWLRRQQNKRLRQFADQLPDFLNLLISSLRAGYGLLHALTVIKDEMPDPMGAEFARVVRETSLGYTGDEALARLVARIGNEDLELIVASIHIQNEVGGNLAEVMETIGRTIRERLQLNGEIRVMTTQQRTTGGILSAMPFVIGAILMLINPDYMMEMFQPGWVLIIPITAVILIVLGNITMRWMMRIEV